MRTRKLFVLVLIISTYLLLNPLTAVFAEELTLDKNVMYLFWEYGCSSCEEAFSLLEDLAGKYPELEIKDIEVMSSLENRMMFHSVGDKFGIRPLNVPLLVFNGKYWAGATQDTAHSIEDELAYVFGRQNNSAKDKPEGANEAIWLTLPLLGQINIDSLPLVTVTALIAFMDGFNPCSLWVLSILLGMMIHSGSRKKMLLVGTTFLLITTIAYGLFIAGILNLFLYFDHLLWIRIIVALIALFFAAVNIKDYFYFKKGISLTIPQKYTSLIFTRIRNILYSSKNIVTVGLTGTMAMGITLVELPCTAGFPVIWSKIVTCYELPLHEFIFLFFIYLMFFLLLEIIVFLGALMTLRISRLTEKMGRNLKLVGGNIMFVLAVILLFNHNYLNSLGNSIIIFALTISMSVLYIFIYERWLYRIKCQ